MDLPRNCLDIFGPLQNLFYNFGNSPDPIPLLETCALFFLSPITITLLWGVQVGQEPWDMASTLRRQGVQMVAPRISGRLVFRI